MDYLEETKLNLRKASKQSSEDIDRTSNLTNQSNHGKETTFAMSSFTMFCIVVSLIGIIGCLLLASFGGPLGVMTGALFSLGFIILFLITVAIFIFKQD